MLPGFNAISWIGLLARVGGNLVSHPWSTVAGAGLTYSAGVLAVGAGTGITVNANDVAGAIGSSRRVRYVARSQPIACRPSTSP